MSSPSFMMKASVKDLQRFVQLISLILGHDWAHEKQLALARRAATTHMFEDSLPSREALEANRAHVGTDIQPDGVLDAMGLERV